MAVDTRQISEALASAEYQIGPSFRMKQISAKGADPDEDVDLADADYNGALPRMLYIQTGGDLVVTDVDGNTVTIVSGDNQYHPIRPAIVESATTCEGIVAFY